MARDANGNWSNPDTQTAGTPARASAVNALINDLGAEITDSLSRTGKGAMSTQLRMAAGSAATPGIAPSGDTNTGMYGKSADKLGFSCGGVEAVEMSTSGVALKVGGTTMVEVSSSGLIVNADGWLSFSDMADIAHGRFIGRLSTSAGAPEACIVPFGQCRLAKSGANLVLSPYKGNLLTINGAAEKIPSGGVTITASGLAASTFYYVYAYMNSGTMTLEFSATASSISSTTGIDVKLGDETRTLVGIIYTTSGAAFADSETQRLVRSYFNDPGITFSNGFLSHRSTASGSFVELNTEIRCEFVTFGNEVAVFSADGYCLNDSANNFTFTAIGIDSTTPIEGLSAAQAYTSSARSPFALSAYKSNISAGYHFATLLGKVSGGTGTWIASSTTAGDRSSLKGMIRGV